MSVSLQINTQAFGAADYSKLGQVLRGLNWKSSPS